MITVTIVDDNEDIRFGLQTLINSNENFNCEFSYGNGRDALDGLISNPTDVVLMDINMPLMNGIEAVKKLKELGSKSLFIMSTIYEDDENIFLSLKAGASGYILKNDPPQKYLEAVSEVYNGGASMNVSVAKKVLTFFNSSFFAKPFPEAEQAGLSSREKEILQLMIEGHDFKMIAEKSFISYDTVRTHVKHIYKKLHVSSRSEAVRKAAHLKAFSKI